MLPMIMGNWLSRYTLSSAAVGPKGTRNLWPLLVPVLWVPGVLYRGLGLIEDLGFRI